MDIRSAMGMGGGTSKKAKLVADLTDEYRKLNLVLERTESLSKSISDNLSKAKAAGGNLLGGTGNGNAGRAGNATMPPAVNTTTGFINQGDKSDLGFMGPTQPSVGMHFAAFGKNLLKGLPALIGTAGIAAMQAIDTDQFIENRIATTRFRFMGGGGPLGGNFQRMMNQGTGTDPMDAARAAMAGMSYGMMPGLANYSSIMQSAATFSNLVPGAGLAGGMQATAALNQAGNVNRLRMIGINVRDANTGLMRSIDDIANDLWAVLNRQKTGGGAITKQDIAMSLQPGNALDSLLNQYFGNDPVLRQGVVTALMQKASGAGLSKEELARTGALSDIAKSIGERQAASYGVVNAYTEPGVSGIMEANRLLIQASNFFRDHVETFGGFVKQLSKLETLAGGGNGAAGTIAGGVMAFLGGALGPLVAGIGGKVVASATGAMLKSSRGILGKMASQAGKIMPALAKGLAKFIPGIGALLSGYEGYKDGADGGFSWGDFLTTTAIGTGTGALFGGLPGAAIGALVSGGGYLVGNLLGNVFGSGGEGDGEESTSKPLAGNPPVTSPFGKVRYLSNNGKQSPTYGRPHGGIDFGVPEGTSVYAAKDGTVLGTNFDANGLGNYVKIRHDDGYESIYGHLSQKLASSGSRVQAGALIGLSGNTGFSTGPHLHFQVQKDGQKYDPMAYISGAGAPTSDGSSVYTSSSNLFGTVQSGSLFSANSAGNLFGMNYRDTMTGSGGESSNGSGGSTINYGGVNISINVPQGNSMDERKLAKEIKRVLEDQEQLTKAVTR